MLFFFFNWIIYMLWLINNGPSIIWCSSHRKCQCFTRINSTTSNTPLHIAALLGHAEFAMVVMQCCPQFATELHEQGVTPIHMASAEGHGESLIQESIYLLFFLSFCSSDMYTLHLRKLSIHNRAKLFPLRLLFYL